MSLETSYLDAIIFDLGEVIIDLDRNRTARAFGELGGKSLESLVEAYYSNQFLQDYETGDISDEEFRDEFRKYLSISASDETIDLAWNQMLLKIPQIKMDLVNRISGQFRLFVLSNTNAIHARNFNKLLDSTTNTKSFDDHFEKVYLSHEIRMAKPDKRAWQLIIDENQLDTTKTLFIDDRKENIEAAAELGLRTFHNIKSDDWMSLF